MLLKKGKTIIINNILHHFSNKKADCNKYVILLM